MLSPHDRTNPDVAASEWAISDAVVRLREWGTDNICALPASPTNQWTIGAGEGCALQLDDPTGRTSRLHAVLVVDGTKLLVLT
jgi:hypothetical protein